MHTHYSSIRKVTLSKSRSETITMPMICSPIEHGFLPVFSIERKVMLYSNQFLCISTLETLLHVTLKRRAKVSADIFVHFFAVFQLVLKEFNDNGCYYYNLRNRCCFL